MKKIIDNEELEIVMKNAVNMICNVTKSTLGPVGSNVLINNSDEKVFITNDGVTIASNIESDDPRINSVLEIVKESSIKTNELVGDGTTTTLVLLQSIFNRGLELIKNGKNRIKIKNELNESLNKCLNILDSYKKIPTEKDLLSIAITSSNDYEIGKIVSEVYSKVNDKYSIRLNENNNYDTYYEIKKGYNLEINNISSLYFKSNKEIVLDNCYIGVIKGSIDNLEQISDIVNEGLINNRNIVIFTEDIDNIVKEELLSYYLNESKKIFIFNLIEFGNRKDKLEEDISKLSSSNIKNILYEEVSFSDLGLVKKTIINKDEVIILSKKENEKKLVLELENELKNISNEYDKEFICERISKLKKGIATIYVGGNTKTEIKEKIMRFDDAVCAVNVAKKGVCLGEGIMYLKLKEELNDQKDLIIKEALNSPFENIVLNNGKDVKNIHSMIKHEKYNKVFNFITNEMENINNTLILDSIEVLKVALTNAVSISSMLLTTNYLIINEKINNEKEIL